MHKSLLFNVCSPSWAGRPAGPYRIAHILREQGWDVEVVDFVMLWTDDELKSLILSRIDKNTKFIGFGHLFSSWPARLEFLCIWIKQQWPDIIIISGSSVMPGFDSKVIDFYIQGFAEVAIIELVSYLFGRGSRPRFDADWLVRGKKIIKANDQYPAYPLKSLMIDYEDRDFLHHSEWLTIEFARGCKFQCAFCNFPILGVKGDYSRDADDAFLQLQKTYDKYGISHYTVSDETFNDRTEKITKFADVVDKLDFTPWFSGYIRADLLISRPLDRQELLRMNFLGQFYGVESFNTDSAKSVGKGMESGRVKQGLIDAKKFFQTSGRGLYRGNIALIIGLPHETEASLQQSYNWLEENWIDQSFDVWALEITRGSNNKDSKISMDMERFGYTDVVMDQDVIDKLNDPDNSLDPSQVKLWQSEHMNIFTAKKIESEFNKLRLERGFKASPFTLSSIFSYNLQLEELLQRSLKSLLEDINYNYTSTDRTLPSTHLVNQYIKNKLSV